MQVRSRIDHGGGRRRLSALYQPAPGDRVARLRPRAGYAAPRGALRSDGDQVAGAAINVIHEGDWGETDDLFVRRPWRRRALGRALLVGSLHLLNARGLVTAGLGVDAENVSGALSLYESVGFRPYQRVVSWRKLR